jgi:hypothetical protein
MKKKFIISLFLNVILFAGINVAENKEKAEDIIQKCSKVMGITTKMKDLKVIKFVETIKKNNRDYVKIIKRPNNIYKKYANGEGTVLLFDGKRAYVLKGKNVEGNIVKKPEVLPKEHWWHFEFDIALIFPVLFDYPVKYVGEKSINDIKHFELSVKMPLGTSLNYFINSKTYLIHKVHIEHLNAKGKMIHIERFFANYKLTDGILFPHDNYNYIKKTGKKNITSYKTIKINPKLETDVTFKFI